MKNLKQIKWNLSTKQTYQTLSNITDDDLDILPQRAKRDITFGDIREQFGQFVTSIVRKIRDTAGHTLAQEKISPRVQIFLIGKQLNKSILKYRTLSFPALKNFEQK